MSDVTATRTRTASIGATRHVTSLRLLRQLVEATADYASNSTVEGLGHMILVTETEDIEPEPVDPYQVIKDMPVGTMFTAQGTGADEPHRFRVTEHSRDDGYPALFCETHGFGAIVQFVDVDSIRYIDHPKVDRP